MIFISTSCYALAKELGPDDAIAEVHRQIAVCAENPASARAQGFLPAVKVIARLRLLDDVDLLIDAGATVIGKARSRMFHRALQSLADTWVTVDDDVDATAQTLEWLLEAVRTGRDASGQLEPRICIAPCLLRRGRNQIPTANVELPLVYTGRTLSGGGKVRTAMHGGFGLVAMNRSAMREIIDHNSFKELGVRFDWLDDDGERKLPLFHDMLRDGQWWGEDLSFFKRVPTSVSIECLETGHTSHDGMVLDLRSVRS